MKIEKIEVGDYKCNCYLIEKDGDFLLIDPGDEYEKIKANIQDKNILGIIITHHHFDHTGCVNALHKEFNIPVYDVYRLMPGKNDIGKFSFELIETFGHTMDSISLYFKSDKIMFTGDFLFRGSVGRCDLLGGNEQEMKKSIDKIKKYPKDTIIYPGHGYDSSLEWEFNNNYYFR